MVYKQRILICLKLLNGTYEIASSSNIIWFIVDFGLVHWVVGSNWLIESNLIFYLWVVADWINGSVP